MLTLALLINWDYSKEALERFVTKGVNDKTGKICRLDSKGFEDVELGKCMEHLNVTFGDSRDAFGRGRFFPLVPEKHFNAGLMDAQSKWFRSEKFYNFEEAYLVLFCT